VARGWESKSVEEQQAAANARRDPNQPRLTPEQLELERKRDSLLLQRSRVVEQIAACTDARYRQTLQNGLDFLEARLREIDGIGK
jgi:hypothetical protein